MIKYRKVFYVLLFILILSVSSSSWFKNCTCKKKEDIVKKTDFLDEQKSYAIKFYPVARICFPLAPRLLTYLVVDWFGDNGSTLIGNTFAINEINKSIYYFYKINQYSMFHRIRTFFKKKKHGNTTNNGPSSNLSIEIGNQIETYKTNITLSNEETTLTNTKKEEKILIKIMLPTFQTTWLHLRKIFARYQINLAQSPIGELLMQYFGIPRQATLAFPRGVMATVYAVSLQHGKWLATGTNTNQIIIWNIFTNECTQSWPLPPETKKINAVTLARNVHTVMVVTTLVVPGSKQYTQWDCIRGIALRSFRTSGMGCQCQFIRQDTHLLVNPKENNGQLHIWDLTVLNPTVVESLMFESNLVNTFDVSPDGRRVVASGLDSGLRLWAMESTTATVLSTLPLSMDHYSYAACKFSDTTEYLIAGKIQGGVEIRCATSLACIKRLAISARIESLSVLPGGEGVVIGTMDGEVTLWDFWFTGSKQQTLRRDSKKKDWEYVRLLADGKLVLLPEVNKAQGLFYFGIYDLRTGNVVESQEKLFLEY